MTDPDRPDRARPDSDRSEGDEGCDPESMAYRLERLRLVRTALTLAVVVARLIRSL
ncbi:hypothetical protein [Halorubrum sp. FL23]|uniref:hypothetical protein n=1 Tax=Halorubrum sp. FL23 TaxID=3458704 RepID=UPI0040336404